MTADPESGPKSAVHILGRRSRAEDQPRILLYDFKRPDKFSKEQIRTLEIIHETFARLASLSLSSQLRLGCEVKVRLVDQMTYGEFMSAVHSPTLLCAIGLKPWKGASLLHYDLELREALLERAFGGPGGPAEPESSAREITDIECTVLERLTISLIESLAPAWEQVEALEPRLLNIETDPRFCQIAPPTEMVVLVGLDVLVGDRLCQMDIVIPYIMIEPIVPKLSAEYWYKSVRASERAAGPSAALLGVETEGELLTSGASLSIGELRALRKGSLVALPGLDEGLGRLRAGGAEVASFMVGDIPLRGSFNLEPLVKAGQAEGAVPTRGTGLEGGLASIERGISGLRDGLEAALQRIGGRLEAIEARQEAGTDLLTFGGADGVSRPEARAESRPFAFLSELPLDQVSLFLSFERPQLLALILAWLDDSLASRILDALPPATQTSVVRRLSRLDGVSPAVVSEVEAVLAKKLGSIGQARRVPGGLHKVVGLLNLTKRATEKNVIEDLDRLDPRLAEEIKKNMFVFEDISLLDAESIALILARVNEDDLALALKPLDKAMREKVLYRFEPGAASRLVTRTEALGRVRLSECDAAGQRVVESVRRLEEDGLILVLRPDEMEA